MQTALRSGVLLRQVGSVKGVDVGRGGHAKKR